MQRKEVEKSEFEVPTLVVESAPSTVHHSKQQLTTSLHKPANHDTLQTESLQRALQRYDEMVSSDGDKVSMGRIRLVEKQPSGEYWISDPQHTIQTDGIRLTDNQIYRQDVTAQRLGLTSHSNTFTIGSQSGTLRLRTESPGPLPLGAVAPSQESEAGVREISGYDTSRKSLRRLERLKSETAQSDTGRSETGRSETGRSETGRSETRRSKRGRSDLRSQRETNSRVKSSGVGDNLYHLLPTEDEIL